MASHFEDFHSVEIGCDKFDDSEDRLTPAAKRLSEGWFLYSLLEIKQRYGIKGKHLNKYK